MEQEQSLEQQKQAIIDELKQRMVDYKMTEAQVLNNFFLWYGRGLGSKRADIKSLGLEDTTEKQWRESKGRSKHEFMSELRYEQTPKDFIAALDDTFSTHLTEEQQKELKEILAKYYEEGALHAVDRQKIHDLLLPLYVALRLKGYTYYDLAT
jgi:hypothetical protein